MTRRQNTRSWVKGYPRFQMCFALLLFIFFIVLYPLPTYVNAMQWNANHFKAWAGFVGTLFLLLPTAFSLYINWTIHRSEIRMASAGAAAGLGMKEALESLKSLNSRWSNWSFLLVVIGIFCVSVAFRLEIS